MKSSLLRWLSLSTVLALLSGTTQPTVGQIVPDDTLGVERSRLNSDVRIRGDRADRITGGAARGRALFHSFSDFNVGDRQRVFFANPVEIDHIFSRVTGNNSSNIMGMLGVEGPASLFFLNPNGIVFGKNAQLDIAGSFMATTADAFLFDNNQIFSASNPEAPPLLTVNVTPGLQWGMASTLPSTPDHSRTTSISSSLARKDGQARLEGRALGGEITSLGDLAVGESLTLAGNRLHLTGRLEAGRNVNVRSLNTIQIRDSATNPFIATAGRHLRIQGESIDISALNHPNSGLTAGQNVTLRSAQPVIGDAHFAAGRAFRVERPGGRLGQFTSPNDPVIRSVGDVSFQDYTGASLHILAGGQVTIPGTITITGADALNNSLQESVTLSDGTTVIEIDGNAEPTLDIRAGMGGNEFSGDRTARGTTIRLGNIRNPGGIVFLTNQYQPNRTLPGGHIQVGAIDTSIRQPTNGRAQGGTVVLDARGSIEIMGNVTTFAHLEIDNKISNTPLNLPERDTSISARGGDIILLSQDTITTQNLDGSAIASIVTSETHTLLPDGTEQVERDQSGAIARGGNIVAATQIRRRNETVSASIGTIETGNINTSARTVVEATANASVMQMKESSTEDLTSSPLDNNTVTNTDSAGMAIGGTVSTARARGGDISLSTDVVTGDIQGESDISNIGDIGNIRTGTINSSAITDIDASANASVDVNGDSVENSGAGGLAIGGSVGNGVSRGGSIRFSTNTVTGDVNTATTLGGVQVADINSSASVTINSSAQANVSIAAFNGRAGNSADSGNATGGSIGQSVSRGGDLSLSTQITTGDVAAASIIGHRHISEMRSRATTTNDTFANARVFVSSPDMAENSGSGGNTNGSNLGNIVARGGTINAMADIIVGDISAGSDVATLSGEIVRTNATIDNDGSAFADPEIKIGGYSLVPTQNTGNGGRATGPMMANTSSLGGAMTLLTHLTAGNVEAASNLGQIHLGNMNLGSRIQTQTTAVTTTDVSVASVPVENRGNGGTSIGRQLGNFLGQGGTLNVSTAINTGNIVADSHLGSLVTELSRTSANLSVDADAQANGQAIKFGIAPSPVSVENHGNGGQAIGARVGSVIGQGGTIDISTRIITGEIASPSDIGNLEVGNLNTSTYVRVDGYANALAYSDGITADSDIVVPLPQNRGSGGTVIGGKVENVTSQSGDIRLSTEVDAFVRTGFSGLASLQTGRLTTISTAFADVSPNADALATQSILPNREAPGRNSGLNGSEEGGMANASAQGGTIMLLSQVTNRSSEGPTGLPFSNGVVPDHRAIEGRTTDQRTTRVNGLTDGRTININAPVLSFARVLVDVGTDRQEQAVDVPNFEATGGNIIFNSEGSIQLGDPSELNANAGLFAIRPIETIGFDGAQLQGGDIRLTANDRINLSQIRATTNAKFIVPISITDSALTRVETLASSAGTLNLQTPQTIRLQNNGLISVEATGGSGTAGNIQINSRSLFLGEQSRILSETESGNGGNITIRLGPDLGGFLLMDSGSSISTTAGTNSQGGNGGNIALNARFIRALPQGNSRIAADAFTGNGGNISITTEGIFGLVPGAQPRPVSNITATSQLGIDGTVDINTLSTDPSRGLIELAAAPAELPPINELCDVTVAGGSAFSMVGRGGIPLSPSDPLNGTTLWEDWHIATPETITLAPDNTINIDRSNINHHESDRSSLFRLSRELGDRSISNRPTSKRPMIEAQGWRQLEVGLIQLVATPINAQSIRSLSVSLPTRSTCQSSH